MWLMQVFECTCGRTYNEHFRQKALFVAVFFPFGIGGRCQSAFFNTESMSMQFIFFEVYILGTKLEPLLRPASVTIKKNPKICPRFQFPSMKKEKRTPVPIPSKRSVSPFSAHELEELGKRAFEHIRINQNREGRS